MKSVAGQLKLNLAQYREMAAFAQFGSDLDKATQEQLANGERLTEMLKQPQYSPISMELQVISIYAATPQESRNSWMRGYSLEDIQRYQREMLAYLAARHPGILETIKRSGKLEKDTAQQLNAALDEFASAFQPSKRMAESATA